MRTILPTSSRRRLDNLRVPHTEEFDGNRYARTLPAAARPPPVFITIGR